MTLVVGLGNPGSEYANNRHNIGFDVIDRLAKEGDVELSQRRFQSRFGQTKIAGEKVILMKPETFMNLSGDAVADAARFYKIENGELIVVHDELDLPLGRLQVRRGGGTAGHNGVTHVAERLGSNDFVRVRVGIGKPEGKGGRTKVIGHVLGDFAADERELAANMIERAAKAVRMIIEKDLKAAMNEFNRREDAQ
jgi:peptidyl-tRNA hydrolase, PTH1 family